MRWSGRHTATLGNVLLILAVPPVAIGIMLAFTDRPAWPVIALGSSVSAAGQFLLRRAQRQDAASIADGVTP